MRAHRDDRRGDRRNRRSWQLWREPAPLHADDSPSADLEIGYAAALRGPGCRRLCPSSTASGVDARRLDRPDPPRDLQVAAAATARVETALVAAEGLAPLRRNCRFHAEVALYTDSDWNRLAQTLAARDDRIAPTTTSRIPAHLREQDDAASGSGMADSERSARGSMRWQRRT